MGLTPLEIRNREFKRTFRGISADETRGFLEQVADEMEIILRNKTDLENEMEALREKLSGYVSREDTIHKTLLLAQKASEETVVNARKQADLIVEEARGQARRIESDFAEIKMAKTRFIMEFEAVVETFRKQIVQLRGESGEEDDEDGDA